MQDYDKEMYAICEKMFNDIGIWGSSDLCRLIGYAEDSLYIEKLKRIKGSAFKSAPYF